MGTDASGKLKIAVVGAGAVGGVLGARLFSRGSEVKFLVRGASLEALNSKGLVVEHPTRRLQVPAGCGYASAEAIGPVDVVLVAVKAGQVPQLAPSLKPLVGESTVVIPMQNGLATAEVLAKVLGEAHVAQGFCRMSSSIVSPGTVKFEGTTVSIAFGRLGKTPFAPGGDGVLERLRTACKGADIAVEEHRDIAVGLWEKFLFVEPLGVVGAGARATVGELMQLPEARRMLLDCAAEIVAVAYAKGVAIPEGWRDRLSSIYAGMPFGGTTSMHRDIMAGRPSELDAQTGSLIQLGEEAKVPTPIHATLYAILKLDEPRNAASKRAV